MASTPEKSAMDQLLSSTELINVSGTGVPPLKNGSSQVFVLYFSAHWCPPCRMFTPRLRDTYNAYRAETGSHKVEVVFVSADRTLPDMLAYMREAHGPWSAVPPGSALQQTLSLTFQVQGIPAVIVVDTSGQVLTRDGRSEVLNLGVAAFKNWESECVDIDTSIVNTLKENPPEVMKEAADIVNKLLGNILRDPNNLKFRNIRLSNPKIESKLLCAVGAFEILFSAGFEEGTDSLVLPYNASLKTLEAFKASIEDILSDKKPPTQTAGPSHPSAASSVPQLPLDSATFANQPGPVGDQIIRLSGEQEFLEKLTSELRLAQAYEDLAAQASARSQVPIDRLEGAARSQLEAADISKANDEKLFRDFFLSELVAWFKNDFFQWFDSPTCEVCQKAMANKGHGVATPEELNDGASRVETYGCNDCGTSFRFPRYHSKPVKLLTTRAGRCGEWSNCFALILRSFGFETRRVLDWTDHVWCEVFSSSEQRWLHVDPCENLIDKPLVYEQGWGKKLTYVIATSKDEVQDVSWRYTCDHKAVKQRRNQVREKWLTKTLLLLSEECQKNLSQDDKKRLTERRLLELVELMSSPSKKATSGELQGRTSGSLAWRLARGEQGSSASGDSLPSYTWRLTEVEKELEMFHLEYNVVTDQYLRPSNKDEVLQKWQSGAENFKDVIRKEEKDWKMVYLARSEGSEKSSISWTLDLSDTNFSVKTIELNVESSVFESGRIVWQLCGGTICLLPLPGTTLKSEGLSGSKKLTLTALMSGGNGSVAWQHTQLFRSKMDERQHSQMKLIVKLQKD